MHGIESGPVHWLMMAMLYLPEIITGIVALAVVSLVVYLKHRGRK
jgi:hypothetical protein